MVLNIRRVDRGMDPSIVNATKGNVKTQHVDYISNCNRWSQLGFKYWHSHGTVSSVEPK